MPKSHELAYLYNMYEFNSKITTSYKKTAYVLLISDKLGRKVIMVSSQIAMFAIVLGTSFCESYTSFIVLRILTGAVQQVRVVMFLNYHITHTCLNCTHRFQT